MIILKLSPEKRAAAAWWILGAAQLAFVTSTMLSYFAGERFSFIIGLLAGFSMVGNIFFLTQYRSIKQK